MPRVTFLFTCILALAVLLPVHAASRSAPIALQELERAVQAQDLQSAREMLVQCGVSQSELAEVIEPDGEAELAVVFSFGDFFVVTVNNIYGYGLWVFLDKNTPGAGWGSLVATESYGRYADLLQDPACDADGYCLFAVHAQQVSGTGVALSSAIWQRLDPTGLRHLLEYPVDGYVVGWGQPFDREFSSEVVDTQWRDGSLAMDVVFSAVYSIDESELFSKKARARFVYDPAQAAMRLAPSASSISMGQIDGLFNDAEDGFVLHNLDSLEAMADTGAPDTLRWLRRLLEACEDAEARAALEKVLDGQGL